MIDTPSELSGLSTQKKSLLPDTEARIKLRRKRAFKDKASRWGITVAGFGVVFALAMIFVYLIYEVAPILRGATVDVDARYSLPHAAETQKILLERYEELGLQYTDDGLVTFFDAQNGRINAQVQLAIPADTRISSFAAAEPISRVLIHGLDNGGALISRHAYDFSFPDDQRLITPKIEYPFGDSPVVIDESGRALTLVTTETVPRGAGGSMVAAVTEDGRLLLVNLSSRTNLLTGAVQVTRTAHELPRLPQAAVPQQLLLDKSLRNLFVLDTRGYVHYFDIASAQQASLVQSVNVGRGSRVTAAEFLVGNVSLIFGTETGELSQWFLVRDEQNNHSLELIRSFRAHNAEITAIAAEHTRKGFVAVDVAGQVGVHYGTSARTLFLGKVSESPLSDVAISQVNGRLLLLDDRGRASSAALWNEHPQLSFSAMWNKVWYEGRAPILSTSGSPHRVPTSLNPSSVWCRCLIGTLKAAFYAMLFAMPLAIAGAIYTAYFMTPKLRGIVKPSIEIMEALPTVILGFLAGLWLAPFAEKNLPAIFSFFILMPVMMLLFAYAWSRLPSTFRNRVPDGWEAALLTPLILVFGYVCVTASPWIEIWFFNGSMRQWFTDIGVTYDQRNALIVGIAMGFAVIPTIFSIAEDAVFTVPRHLTQGSSGAGFHALADSGWRSAADCQSRHFFSRDDGFWPRCR
jgi:phosphate transport system permease protein